MYYLFDKLLYGPFDLFYLFEPLVYVRIMTAVFEVEPINVSEAKSIGANMVLIYGVIK